MKEKELLFICIINIINYSLYTVDLMNKIMILIK